MKDHSTSKYQRRWNQALIGEFIHGLWKMAASQTTSLFPRCSLCDLLKRFVLNCSIFKVTVWFRIHNHSCMNVQFYFSPQTNHLLRPRMLTLFFVHWLICLLSLHSSFISNLKANISGLNITLLPYILSLSLYIMFLSLSCYHIQESFVNAMRE